MNTKINNTHISKTFVTESGYLFPELNIAWKSWGKINETRDNVILICHALTGNEHADDWFHGLFEEDGPFDFEEHYVLCINNLGSCYGSTSPTSINQLTGKAFQANFPDITIRDIVRFQQLLLDELQISGIEVIIGASMGGMIALEFNLMDPRVQKTILIAMGKEHSAWAIGISEAQRAAIQADQNWLNGFYSENQKPDTGLAAARMMAMITYRSSWNYSTKFGRAKRSTDQFQVESYLNYQGDKLVDRFDANSYITLTKAMDSHDISRNRGDHRDVLNQITNEVLIVGIESDLLYPLKEQEELAELIPNSTLHVLQSEFGHDAFLLEFDLLKPILNPFIKSYQSV